MTFFPAQESLPERLAQRGVTRRAFLNFCGVMAATLALPAGYRTQIAEALATVRRPVLIWRQFQDCAGNSESILRSPHPDVAEIVLETLAWNYHELVMAGSGDQAEAMSTDAVRNHKGKYIAVIEGAIPTGADGAYCTIGGRSALDIAREVAGNAAWTIAVGACAWDGGLVQHGPTGALGVEEAVPDARVINLGGCPHNPANTVAVLVHYLTFGEMPALDRYSRPLFAYGDLIHDQCERRAYYDAGLFVEEWGDEGHRNGYCLYKMGCKGPSATYNCPNVRWNDGTSWPVQAGHNCIACAAPEFWASMSPFYERLPNVPGFGADTTASTVGLAVIGGTAALMAAHAIGKGVQTRAARVGGAHAEAPQPATPPPQEDPPTEGAPGDQNQD
ncbi:MAG: hydrogenase small subunit [Solirubrobacteraceae bacterium]